MFLVYTFIKNPKGTVFIFYLGENFEILTMSHIFFVVFLADFIYFWQLCQPFHLSVWFSVILHGYLS